MRPTGGDSSRTSQERLTARPPSSGRASRVRLSREREKGSAGAAYPAVIAVRSFSGLSIMRKLSSVLPVPRIVTVP